MKLSKSILITGASGFVGRNFVDRMKGLHSIKIVSLRTKNVDEVNLSNIVCIVHLAGKAHDMSETDQSEYFSVNRDLTMSLARKAKKAGVKHFIFMSSVKVYGDSDTKKNVFNEFSVCRPNDPYGLSKLEAEQGLLDLQDSAFVISIIRSPLIYGAGVKGNLDRMIRLCLLLPVLPFANIQNERSMVYVGNVAALIQRVIGASEPGVFIAGDAHRRSTSELIEMILLKMSIDKPLLSMPRFIRFFLKKINPKIYNRLFENYVFDNSLTNRVLNFTAPYSFEHGIQEMTSHYLSNKSQ